MSWAKCGRDLDGDEAVLAAAAQIHRSEDVAGGAHVFDRQTVEDLRRLQALARELQDLLVVTRPGADGLLEDGRVAGDAAEAVAVDHPPETAAGHELAADVVEPGALAELMKLGEPALSGRHVAHSPFASAPLALASSWSVRPPSLPVSVSPKVARRLRRHVPALLATSG